MNQVQKSRISETITPLFNTHSRHFLGFVYIVFKIIRIQEKTFLFLVMTQVYLWYCSVGASQAFYEEFSPTHQDILRWYR